MSNDFPATTVRVVSITPCDDTKVCIMMEMIADVNRLAEVGSEMLHAAIRHMKTMKAKDGDLKPQP
jgi:hypothetical protein